MNEMSERMKDAALMRRMTKHLIEASEIITMKDQEYFDLAARYDEALKRINDLEAELEFLRNELARKQ